jgi:hypothetical protein
MPMQCPTNAHFLSSRPTTQTLSHVTGLLGHLCTHTHPMCTRSYAVIRSSFPSFLAVPPPQLQRFSWPQDHEPETARGGILAATGDIPAQWLLRSCLGPLGLSDYQRLTLSFQRWGKLRQGTGQYSALFKLHRAASEAHAVCRCGPSGSFSPEAQRR